MNQKFLPLLTIAGLVAALAAIDVTIAEADNREAAPGQVARSNPLKTGGPDCASPTVVTGVDPSTPFVDTGNNCGAATDVIDYRNATCNSVPDAYPGPEQIYQIELLANNNILVELEPSALVDLGLFMVADCTTPTSCVDFHDFPEVGGKAELPRVQTGSYAPGTYFFYIDSYYATGTMSCGDYTFTVSGSIPVELINFSIE